jgi:hydroxymethylglutaryl-CoA lyase
VIDALVDAGLRHIEATSFVSPKAVPQLADAHDVIARLKRRAEAHIAALAPNARGAERALAAGVDEIIVFISASETHNAANLNAPIEGSLANAREVAQVVAGARRCAARSRARSAARSRARSRSTPRCASSTRTRASASAAHARRHDRHGDAADSDAAGARGRDRFPSMKTALHFHNTRGVGLANVVVGLELGIREYESSIAGLGGCPFAPGATGNICTEDLVYLLEESGYDTGVDLES